MLEMNRSNDNNTSNMDEPTNPPSNRPDAPLCGLMDALTTTLKSETAAAAPTTTSPNSTPRLIKTSPQTSLYLTTNSNSISTGIKVLHIQNPTESQILRLVHERNVSNFLPPSIRARKVSDVKSHNGHPAIQFEWAKGTPLSEWIEGLKSRTDVNDAIRLRVAIAVAETLNDFHVARVAFCNLSGRNVILDTFEGSYVVTLVDLSEAVIYETDKAEEYKRGICRDLKDLGRLLQELFGCEVDEGESLNDESPGRVNNDGPNKRVKRQLYRKPEELPMYLSSIISTLNLSGESSCSHTELYSSVKDVLFDLRFISKNPSAHLKPFVLDEATMNNRLTFCQDVFYGRQSEKSLLMHALNSVVQLGGQPTMTMVSGFPGTGKTCLIEQINEPLAEANGHLIRGKFEELNSSQDSVIFSAFNAFFTQLYQEADAEFIAEISHNINASIGESGARVLIRSIPSLGAIMKDYYTENNESSAGFSTAEQRWKYLLCKLVAAVACEKSPIVIFLDDLQWACDDSLDVLRLMATDADIKYCLFLGAYRDNDGHSFNRIRKVLDTIQERGVSLMSVKIGPMVQDSVNTLVAELLCLPPRLSQPLSTVIHTKTGGIALFVLKFLKSLNSEGLLWFSLTSRRWEFDISKIRRKEISKDVVTHMTERMTRLSPDIQSGLKFAACIGGKFTMETLELAIPPNGVDLQDFVRVVLEGGFLHETSPDGMLMWVHDEIQKSAYNLIPEDKRESFHLLLGTRMYLRAPSESLDNVLFSIVCNMNAGMSLIKTREQKYEVAKLNLRAGTRLISTSAFSTAAKYLVAGCQLLDAESWEDPANYDFTLRCHDAAGEALFAVGDFSTLQKLMFKPILRARCFEDKLNAYHHMIRLLSSSGKMREVVTRCIEILSHLGETIPDDVSEESIKQEAERVLKALSVRSEKDILSLPVLKDQRKIAIMMFMNHTVTAAYVVRPNLVSYLVFRMVMFSIEHGVCNISTFAFSLYGSYLLCNPNADFERGYRMGKVSLELLKRLKADEFIPRVYAAVYGVINPWKEPYQASLAKHIEAYGSGALSGDMEFAVVNLFQYANSALFACGVNLQKLEATVKLYIKRALQISQHMHAKTLVIIHETIAALTGSNEDSYTVFLRTTEEQLFADARDNQQTVVCRYILHKCKYVAFIGGDMNAAARMFKMSLQHPLSSSGKMVNIHVSLFIDGLIAFFFARKAEADNGCWRRIGESVLLMFRKWASKCSWNFLNCLFLLQAERLFLIGEDAPALEKYNLAIRAARQHRFIHNEAIAHERLAWFHLAKSRNGEATQSFTEAKNCYTKWGALGIVGRIEDIIQQIAAK